MVDGDGRSRWHQSSMVSRRCNRVVCRQVKVASGEGPVRRQPGDRVRRPETGLPAFKCIVPVASDAPGRGYKHAYRGSPPRLGAGWSDGDGCGSEMPPRPTPRLGAGWSDGDGCGSEMPPRPTPRGRGYKHAYRGCPPRLGAGWSDGDGCGSEIPPRPTPRDGAASMSIEAPRPVSGRAGLTAMSADRRCCRDRRPEDGATSMPIEAPRPVSGRAGLTAMAADRRCCRDRRPGTGLQACCREGACRVRRPGDGASSLQNAWFASRPWGGKVQRGASSFPDGCREASGCDMELSPSGNASYGLLVTSEIRSVV